MRLASVVSGQWSVVSGQKRVISAMTLISRTTRTTDAALTTDHWPLTTTPREPA
jgi:hypothetical protein